MSFVAISSVRFPKASKDGIHAAGLEMLPIARMQPGFVSIAFHEAADDDETMMYWEWESPADHEACMNSADWSELMSRHGELFATQGVNFSIRTYRRLA